MSRMIKADTPETDENSLQYRRREVHPSKKTMERRAKINKKLHRRAMTLKAEFNVLNSRTESLKLEYDAFTLANTDRIVHERKEAYQEGILSNEQGKSRRTLWFSMVSFALAVILTETLNWYF